ncbi:hypothetical protein CRE_21626 [Caenorhabditis remanei]|uniref:DUF19 domain-containing protein n=1 Tax=Caenorhabditis remanei TaxID=31234 RepID=E3NP67_CAERE|nr:hypothetical protein CRE_21626 [Caenorhabditis remanei]
MFLFLLVLVPIATSGQETIAPTVLDPQCVEDFNVMLGCVKNRTVFSRIDDLSLNEEWLDRNLAAEIGNVISCSRLPTCSSAQIFYIYLQQVEWAIGFYYRELESCLGNGTLKEIKRICNSIPRPPSDEVDLSPCQGFFDPCLSDELVKQKTCTDEHLPNFQALSSTLYTDCKALYQNAADWKQYSIYWYRSS